MAILVSKILVSVFLLTLVATRDMDNNDNEPGDDLSDIDDGSGVPSSRSSSKPPSLYDKMRFVTYSRKHDSVVLNTSLVNAVEIVRRHGLDKTKSKSIDCFSGEDIKAPMGVLYESDEDESSDESDYELSGAAAAVAAAATGSRRYPDPNRLSPMERSDTSSYPGFATGLLTSKNCTAFLIGSMSALTLAECVYDKFTEQWTTELDMWRGRNCKTYINLMKWESVTIPSLYFTNSSEEYNWAYIKYEEDSASRNWIGLSYDCHITNKRDVHVTLSGYKQTTSCPYKCPCVLLGDKRETFCPSSTPIFFPGSPLVAAPSAPPPYTNSQYIGTSPRLYGIASSSIGTSMNRATMITEEMFWLIYDLMEDNDDRPKCDSMQQEWFVNRVFKD